MNEEYMKFLSKLQVWCTTVFGQEQEMTSVPSQYRPWDAALDAFLGKLHLQI